MLPQSHIASVSPQMHAQHGFQTPAHPIALQTVADAHLQPISAHLSEPPAASGITVATVVGAAADASFTSTELAANGLAPQRTAVDCSPTSDAQIVKLPNGSPLLIKGDRVRVLHRTQSDGDDSVFLLQGLVISPTKGWAKSIESVLQV